MAITKSNQKTSKTTILLNFVDDNEKMSFVGSKRAKRTDQTRETVPILTRGVYCLAVLAFLNFIAISSTLPVSPVASPSAIHLDGISFISCKENGEDFYAHFPPGVKKCDRQAGILPKTDLNVIKNVVLRDWTMPDWVEESAGDLNLTNQGEISVGSTGVYWIYSQFYFHSSGDSCVYGVQFVNDDDDDDDDSKIVKCLEEGSFGSNATKACTLGFVRKLTTGSKIRVVYIKRSECGAHVFVTMGNNFFGAVRIE